MCACDALVSNNKYFVMSKLLHALFCALLVLALLQSTNCGKFGRRRGHSYTSVNGLSGSHSHGYPSSGSLSGSGSENRHGYPSSAGMSGGSHEYPNRRTSGNTHHKTVINHNYYYSPPQLIRYAAPGQAAHLYPIYHGTPPNYVYQYKNSDSKYGTLLAGLALLNLGTLGASRYAASKASASSDNYKSLPGEYCKFGIKKDNDDYEETKIDCNLISSFIYQEQARRPQQITEIYTTVVTNMTVENMTNGVPNALVDTDSYIIYKMLVNGTFAPVNGTLGPVVSSVPTVNATAANGTVASMTVTTTTTNTTTLSDALDVKGDAIKVTPGMQCVLIRHTITNNMTKTVPCGLLQSYADQSIKRNWATKKIPIFIILGAIVAFFVVLLIMIKYK